MQLSWHESWSWTEVRLIFIQARGVLIRRTELPVRSLRFSAATSRLSGRGLSPLSFFSSLLHTLVSDTRFNRDGCQGNLGTGVSHGLLKRLKGTSIPFRNGNDGRAMKSYPILLWSIRNRESLNLEILLIVLLIFDRDSYLILLRAPRNVSFFTNFLNEQWSKEWEL